MYSIHGATIGIADLYHPTPPSRMRADSDFSTFKKKSLLSLWEKKMLFINRNLFCCHVGLWHSCIRGDFLLKVLKQNSRGGDETKDAFNLEGFIRKAALE